jgi:hypothetical protein
MCPDCKGLGEVVIDGALVECPCCMWGIRAPEQVDGPEKREGGQIV